jgi:radical SAM protein with 4Fe4S-binding SPASM domain
MAEHGGVSDGNPAFCMAPWSNLHVQAEGFVTPCCETRQRVGNINRTPFPEIWNGSEMTAVRRQMLAGEKLEGCRKCYDKEAAGVRSFRQDLNDQARHLRARVLSDGLAGDARPVFWDIRFSNLCNFRCRSCWHGSSSRWFADAKLLGNTAGDRAIIQGVEDAGGLFDQLDSILPEVEEIYFAGGEPLIMEEHYRLLDILTERGLFDIPLRYNTNFSETAWKDRDVFDVWARFSRVTVRASVDATGARGELMRKGQDWAQFLANGARLRAIAPKVDLATDTTVSVLNILHLPQLFRELLDAGFAPAERLRLHLLQEPRHYNIRILPGRWKDRARAALAETIGVVERATAGTPDRDTALAVQRTQVAEIESYMDGEDWSAHLPGFRDITRRLDALRHEQTAAVFPELASLLNASEWPGRARRAAGSLLRRFRSPAPAPAP